MLKKQTLVKTKKNPKAPICFKVRFHFSVILISILMVSTSYAAEASSKFDYHGVSAFYGKNEWTRIGPEASDDYTWSNISYVLGKNLTPWISFEVLPGAGYLKSRHFDETGSAELRFLLNLHHDFFFLKFGGGMAHLFDPGNMPDISDANLYGIISGRIGLCYRIQKNNRNVFEFNAGYAMEHLSDPFKNGSQGDTGWNVGAFSIQIIYNF